MQIQQLIHFLQVAESGSINKAAQNSYVSQQAINVSLRKLETELEAKLLERTHKGITLTPQGYVFINYAKEIVKQYEASLAALRYTEANALKLSGTLSIFTASVFTDILLPSAVTKFTQIYPNTTIKIIETNQDELLSYITHGYCEIAFLSAAKLYFDHAFQDNQVQHNQIQKKIKLLPLLNDYQVIVAKTEHPLMQYPIVTNEILADYFSNERTQYSLYQTLPVSNVQASYESAVSISNNAELHKKLLQDGKVVTYMPHLAYQRQFQSDGFASVKLECAYPIQHCLIYIDNPESENYLFVHEFLQLIQKKVQKEFKLKENKS